MPGSEDRDRCIVVLSASEPDGVYDRIYAPAAREANLQPERAQLANTARARALLIRQLHDAAIALVDARGADPYCYFALGIATSLGQPVLVITLARDEFTFGLEDEELLEFEGDARDPNTVSELAQAVTERLRDRGRARASSPRRLPSAEPEGALPPAALLVGMSHSDAQNLINALWSDGVSAETIREELLAAGVPRAWIDLRLSLLRRNNRSGW